MSGRATNDAEDLLVHARRGSLSRSEQRELERVLRADPTLELALRVGADMDRFSAVQPGDEQLILRATDAALAKVAGGSAPRVSPRPARRVHHMAARIALGASVLAAACWFMFAARRSEPASRQAPPPLAAKQIGLGASASARPSAPTARAAVAPGQPAMPPSASSASGVSSSPKRARPARANRAAPELSAAELFRRANRARAARARAAARRDYERLIARFPDSNEAQLAQLSLGKLLLAQGASEAAEREFERYLARGPGQLAEEALVSRAQTFETLERHNDERRIWQQLLREHPGSVYAARAKQRISALDAIGASGP